ncbi:hypothetical protein [Paenirhodobacter ferrireducens]|uniref:hypothetical protein n=1 Tax=Paenirhodobacter ferrireducens TaxID=1215032 RepID=UPI0013E2DFB0|nr:hypothetical protein [Sinirhodobacter ferrireducens]
MSKTKTPRWMKSILAEAAQSEAQMPWARGACRAAMIARRAAAEAASRAPQCPVLAAR